MRQRGVWGRRRVLLWAVLASFVLALAVPGIAAATTPAPTCNLSTYYQPKAAQFRVYGGMGKAYAGKSIRILVRKPGRSYWSVLCYRKLNTSGNYQFYYTPKLAGKFLVTVRYGTGTVQSRIRTLTVVKGPGVKYQILLASTTSTRDSGLFELLGPAFLADCPEYTIKATWVGSGAAIQLGRTGDADVLLTHSPAAERSFMDPTTATTAAPYTGKSRYKVMYNDFVLVGPKNNPAGITTTDTALAAFQKIVSTQSTFWSRNDASGTNAKEKEIWALLGNPQVGQSWYKASGTMGMAQALSAANDGSTGGYTLSDRATWLYCSKTLGTVGNLQLINEGDSRYFNQYSVIEVKGARNWDGAMDFSQWIRSPKAQELIRTYGNYTYPGQTMFVPNAGSYAAGQ